MFRNIAQYQQLSSELNDSAKVLVIGGGFVGSELAYAMTQTGWSQWGHSTLWITLIVIEVALFLGFCSF